MISIGRLLTISRGEAASYSEMSSLQLSFIAIAGSTALADGKGIVVVVLHDSAAVLVDSLQSTGEAGRACAATSEEKGANEHRR